MSDTNRPPRICVRPPGWLGADASGSAARILAWVERAEALGFDGVFVGDRLLDTATTADGRPVYGASMLEATTLLAAIAARTRRMLLGPLIMVVPFRHPVQLAKTLASLDVIADGRLVLGAGPGWSGRELELLGVDARERGGRFEEGMELMRRLWTGEPVSHAGRWFELADVVVEATGHAVVGLRHARRAIDAGCHVVMVTVEADVLAGPGLAARARRAGVVYSLAYGDQPALICEQVDWARTSGFEVVAAGKGTKYRPGYHAVTPDEVWRHYGVSEEAVRAGGLNARMFTSFLDGTKSAIEMAAVANATGLDVPPDGLAFPPAGADELASVLAGRRGVVEVVASERRDGSPVGRDLRWGVYVVVRAADAYVAARFADYGLATDESGMYAALYRPYHLIGLELGVSVAAVALEGEPTGAPRERRGEVAAVAKRDLAAGETLDGEGGYTVWGRLLPAVAAGDALPIGLAQGARLTAPVAAGEIVRIGAVEPADVGQGLALRDELLAEGTAA